jgi:hypothetical protein
MDVSTDINNCGACGIVCPAGNRCARGQCGQCATDLFFCPSGTGEQREVCLSQAKSAQSSVDAGTRGDGAASALSPNFECQCNQCLTELKDCANDYYCALAWQCAVKRGCSAGCWGPMAVCQLGSNPGCFKWCPPLTDTTQTAARVEALLRCTREKGCGI